MVMMQIKFNSLFYKLADAVWQSRAASLRQGALGFWLGSPVVRRQVLGLL